MPSSNVNKHNIKTKRNQKKETSLNYYKNRKGFRDSDNEFQQILLPFCDLLQRNEPRRVGGTNTRSSVFNWLV